MTFKELKELNISNEHGVFTPLYTYEDLEYDDEIEDYVYIGFTVNKTAQEVYQKWLEQKDLPPQPSKIEILEEKVTTLEESQVVQDLLIDDLVFEVIPSLETQIASADGTIDVTPLMKKLKVATSGMALYLANKIIEGKDYKSIFEVNVYKQYKDEVDAILKEKGKDDLIPKKRTRKTKKQ